MVDLIKKKRDGHPHSKEEIDFIIREYTKDTIPDYQMSAWAMSVFFQGMDDEETAALTNAMVHSGDVIDLSAIAGIKVDKHSTGGVGDTVTLPLVSLVASVGVPVPKMSGRGLGHTGGTIDKLESISGFHVEITNEQFTELVNENKVAVIGQTENLTPADKKLYGLRDVTATVDSIPLIASSIMSKKIASGAEVIVLDVKTGSGAFMKELGDSIKLAETMVKIGNNLGRKTAAIISDMNQPLGYAIGNALEIKEAIDTLKGKGPVDLTELCLTLGSHMVVLGEKARTLEEAREMLLETLVSGKGLERFKTFVEAQGGDPAVVDHPEKLPQAKYKIEIEATEEGFISHIDANKIGTTAMLLGAGRARKDSIIDLSVGIVLHRKIGDEVKIGDTLATVHSNVDNIEGILEKVKDCYRFSKNKVAPKTLIYDVIQ